MPEFHAEAPHAIVREGLAQGLYVAVRAGVEPMTIRTKGVDFTNAPHRPQICQASCEKHCSSVLYQTTVVMCFGIGSLIGAYNQYSRYLDG